MTWTLADHMKEAQAAMGRMLERFILGPWPKEIRRFTTGTGIGGKWRKRERLARKARAAPKRGVRARRTLLMDTIAFEERFRS